MSICVGGTLFMYGTQEHTTTPWSQEYEVREEKDWVPEHQTNHTATLVMLHDRTCRGSVALVSLQLPWKVHGGDSDMGQVPMAGVLGLQGLATEMRAETH
jgi:hypothetical protein